MRMWADPEMTSMKAQRSPFGRLTANRRIGGVGLLPPTLRAISVSLAHSLLTRRFSSSTDFVGTATAQMYEGDVDRLWTLSVDEWR